MRDKDIERKQLEAERAPPQSERPGERAERTRSYADFDREQAEHEGRELRQRHSHYSLAGVHDLGDLSELRDRYKDHAQTPGPDEGNEPSRQ